MRGCKRMVRIEEFCCCFLCQSGIIEKKNKKINNLKYSYDQLYCNEKIYIFYMIF